MKTSKNKVELTGNLGTNPEIRNFDNGSKMARWSMATSESYKNQKGEYVTDTQWHNIVAWGKTAELADKMLKKGTEISVEGKLCSRSYTDKTGAKKYITEIRISEFSLVEETETVKN